MNNPPLFSGINKKPKAPATIVMICTAAVMALSISCKKKETPPKADFYYVKYNVSSSTVQTGGKLDVNIADVNGNKTYTINTRTTWEVTVGPVSKHFLATLNINKAGSPSSTLKLYGQIHVSRNNEPFVLKKNDGSDSPRNTLAMDFLVGE
jgi:hypothetical protein